MNKEMGALKLWTSLQESARSRILDMLDEIQKDKDTSLKIKGIAFRLLFHIRQFGSYVRTVARIEKEMEMNKQ